MKNTFICSTFDLKSRFWQVLVAKESRPWTAFITHDGHYEWIVISLALKNVPQIFERKIDDIFRKHSDFIKTYIDDILVSSKFVKEHIHRLMLFFEECQENDIALSEKKIKIGSGDLIYRE